MSHDVKLNYVVSQLEDICTKLESKISSADTPIETVQQVSTFRSELEKLKEKIKN